MYQYSKMAPRLSGQNCNFFKSFFCLSIPKGDLDTEKTTPNREVCPDISNVDCSQSPIFPCDRRCRCCLLMRAKLGRVQNALG